MRGDKELHGLSCKRSFGTLLVQTLLESLMIAGIRMFDLEKIHNRKEALLASPPKLPLAGRHPYQPLVAESLYHVDCPATVNINNGRTYNFDAARLLPSLVENDVASLVMIPRPEVVIDEHWS